jgi:hypothetical protein
MLNAWTFESLAAADVATLDRVMLTGQAPDPSQMNGFVYRGWNHEAIAALTGAKFEKGFFRRDGRDLGYNLPVVQDNQGYRGEWQEILTNGQSTPFGFFLNDSLAREPIEPFVQQYPRAGIFNYNLPVNTGFDLRTRVLRDVVVLPNADDHGLILGKAHFQLFPLLTFFMSYFVLGYREPTTIQP